MLDAKPSKAVLYINFIPVSPTRTRIQTSGSLNRASLPIGSGNVVSQGINTGSGGINASINITADAIRSTYAGAFASVPGKFYKISGESNPFRGTGSSFNFASPPTPTNSPFWVLRPTGGTAGLGGQDFWIPDSYVTNTAYSGFFEVNASLSEIGLLNRGVTYTIGSEQIVLSSVPSPVPVLGATAAFGFSRKLRKRIRSSHTSTSPMPGSAA